MALSTQLHELSLSRHVLRSELAVGWKRMIAG